MSILFPNPQDKLPGGVCPRISRSVLAAALLLGAPMIAQLPGAEGPIARPQVLDPSLGFRHLTIETRQVKMLNIERQKAIVTDTDRILQLARELNADANSGNSSMSLTERLRKADEIAKLAKTVREKMAYAIGMPLPANPYVPLQPPR